MAGRGGGRGRGRGLTFNVEALGFGRGDALPPPTLQPPPLFPLLELKPVPLESGKEQEYLVALKQELRTRFQNSGYFIEKCSKKKDIERYSDKYLKQDLAEKKILFDYDRLPKELQAKKKRKGNVTKPNVQVKKIKNEAISKKFEELEAAEKQGSGDEEEEKKEKENDENEDGAEEEDILDEDDLEEGTDYAANYFDNGEEYLEEDDNLDDGPVY